MNALKTALVVLAASAALGVGSAQAGVTIPGTVILPNALSYEYFGLNYANNEVTSSSIGSLNYSAGAGCGGTCIATTALGSDPSVNLQVNEIRFDGAGGGYAEAELAYYVEYKNATPGTYNVDLHANDSFSSNYTPGYSSGQSYIGIGLASNTPQYINNFGSYLYQETDCEMACSSGVANYTHPAPIPAIVPLQMVANTPYEVEMFVTISPGTTGLPLVASFDPIFTSDATGGSFAFSPGVSAGVPEPAAWAMLLLGFCGIGFMVRRARRKQVGTAAAA